MNVVLVAISHATSGSSSDHTTKNLGSTHAHFNRKGKKCSEIFCCSFGSFCKKRIFKWPSIWSRKWNRAAPAFGEISWNFCHALHELNTDSWPKTEKLPQANLNHALKIRKLCQDTTLPDPKREKVFDNSFRKNFANWLCGTNLFHLRRRSQRWKRDSSCCCETLHTGRSPRLRSSRSVASESRSSCSAGSRSGTCMESIFDKTYLPYPSTDITQTYTWVSSIVSYTPEFSECPETDWHREENMNSTEAPNRDSKWRFPVLPSYFQCSIFQWRLHEAAQSGVPSSHLRLFSRVNSQSDIWNRITGSQ